MATIGTTIMKNKYQTVFEELGMAKNEAKIYEALLRTGQSGVSSISNKAEINRRNVYDSLSRLIERGLVFEIREGRENTYKAIDPKKLMESVREKELALDAVMPELAELYGGLPHHEEIYIYKGIEGWKNYMRELVEVGEDNYNIGGKGAWSDERLQGYGKKLYKELRDKGMKFHMLYDHEVKNKAPELIERFDGLVAYLPKGYSTEVTLDIFGDRVVATTGTRLKQIDDNFSITVVVNQILADAFRTWWKLLKESCEVVRER